MKRILMISTHGYFESKPSFGLPDTGGQVVFVIELSRALAKFGYKVDILTRKFEDFPQIEKVSDEVRIVRVPCGGRDFIPKEYLVKYLAELVDGFVEYGQHNGLEYEFIDSHYWDAGFVGTKLAPIFGVPHMFTPHSLGIWKKMQMQQTSADTNEAEMERQHNFRQRIEAEKTIMSSASKVIATTPQQRDIIHEKYGVSERGIALTTPGFYPDKFRRMDKDTLNRAIDKYKLPLRFVLAVGRITDYKGYDLLIKAMANVVKEMPDIKLILRIGSDRLTEEEIRKKKELLQLAESLDLVDNILFYNYVEDLEAFYNAAEVFVLPSTYEPFGMVAIESMACGTPAIVTTKGGLKSFLKDGQDALLVDPVDTRALAEAILRLLKDKALHNKLSANGYEKAYSVFTWPTIADRTLKIVKQL
jgi:mannosylfructose-phosphate synthase